MLAGILLMLAATLTPAGAEALEVLTPRSGETILARHAETHLILCQPTASQPVQIRVGSSSILIDPVVSTEGADGIYQHYRIPLETGANTFTLLPDGETFRLNFQRIQSAVQLKSRNKDISSFHQEDNLPDRCRDCHDLRETGDISPIGLTTQKSCGSCHGNLVERSRWRHSTTVNGQCLSCHQLSTTPWRIGMPKAQVQDLCFSCHTGKKDWFQKKVFHGPLTLGGCTLCHDPHGENNRHQLWADGALNICVGCHSDKAQLVATGEEQKVPYVHGVLGGPGCVACHDPHATDELLMLHKPINELCSGCHPGPADPSGHPLAGHPVAGPKEYIRPDRELSCTSCHEPHGSYNRYLLIETNLGGRLCRECHSRR